MVFSVERKTAARAAVSRHDPHVAQETARADDPQVHLADRITRSAGSLPFVHVHVVLLAVWMLLLERSPWPSVTSTSCRPPC